MDGIEQCGRNPQSKNETSIETENGEKSTFETTSTTTSTTTLSTTTATSTTTTTTTSEKQGEASRLIMRTCEDLMNAGDYIDDLNIKHLNNMNIQNPDFSCPVFECLCTVLIHIC